MSIFERLFLARARPLIWAIHAEEVSYQPSQGHALALPVIWSGGTPAATRSEGIGAHAASGEATVRVRVSDLPQPDGRARIVRHGQPWIIAHIVRQDQAVWILHLTHPRPEVRLPDRLRP